MDEKPKPAESAGGAGLHDATKFLDAYIGAADAFSQLVATPRALMPKELTSELVASGWVDASHCYRESNVTFRWFMTPPKDVKWDIDTKPYLDIGVLRHPVQDEIFVKNQQPTSSQTSTIKLPTAERGVTAQNFRTVLRDIRAANKVNLDWAQVGLNNVMTRTREPYEMRLQMACAALGEEHAHIMVAVARHAPADPVHVALLLVRLAQATSPMVAGRWCDARERLEYLL